jgi:hypothetical protein
MIRANTPGGVSNSSAAPAAPPVAATSTQGRSQGHVPVSPGREPKAEPGQQATRATLLATVAGNAGRPTASSAG